jgi:hypothetical protein
MFYDTGEVPMPTSTVTPSNSTATTLAELKAQFAHWRATRSKVGKIPEPLWDGVRQLTKQYGHSQIASELGLNFQQMRSKLQNDVTDEQSTKDPFVPAPSGFIEAALPSMASYGPVPQTTTLELSRPDGIVLKAMGLGSQETLALLERFLK